MPEHIAFLLHALGTLLGYGRHLLDTVHRRATAPTFPTIAACFGTANLSTLIAHLHPRLTAASCGPPGWGATCARAPQPAETSTSQPPAPAWRTNHRPRQRPPKP